MVELDEAKDKCYTYFQTLENTLTANDTLYYATNHPTIADHQLFFEMTDTILLSMPLDRFPRIKQWMTNCENAPGIRELHKQWRKEILPIFRAQIN